MIIINDSYNGQGSLYQAYGTHDIIKINGNANDVSITKMAENIINITCPHAIKVIMIFGMAL